MSPIQKMLKRRNILLLFIFFGVCSILSSFSFSKNRNSLVLHDNRFRVNSFVFRFHSHLYSDNCRKQQDLCKRKRLIVSHILAKPADSEDIISRIEELSVSEEFQANKDAKESIDYVSIKEEIEQIIIYFLSNAAKKDKSRIHTLDEGEIKKLTESAHILTNGRLYEQVIGEFLEASTSADIMYYVEQVDQFMSSFISAERKKRSRLKLNYILAGAAESRLDDTIKLLRQSEELDNELLIYIDSLIKKELLKVVGPNSYLDDSVNIEDDAVEQRLVNSKGK